MRRVPTLKQQSARSDPKAREFDRLFRNLGSMPQVLCWSCRRLTAFEVDRCEHCGSPFAGSTGGAYRAGRMPTDMPVSAARTTERPRGRSLAEIVEDLRRIRDLSHSPRRSARRGEAYRYSYQCPSCDRYVTEQATTCVCGVRFAPPSTGSFDCPECAANVPFGHDSCPVCRVDFRRAGLRDEYVYACPRCGSRVGADAFRCSCGVRFQD
jgi:hypothetical protein